MTLYPAQIDNSTSLPDVIDDVTALRALVVNQLKSAIVAVETELGENPSGVYTTVRARFDALEATVGNLQIIRLAGDLGNTLTNPHVVGFRGFPLASTIPTTGQLMAYVGNAWAPINPPPSVGGFTPAGDLTGTNVSQEVVGLRNIPLSTTLPATNQVLGYNGSVWGPVNQSGGGAFTPNVVHTNVSYTVQLPDYLISVENTTTAVTITLDASPPSGKIVVIKDANGNATSHNITIVTSDGSNIDGLTQYVLGVNYDKVTLGYNGSNWEVLVSSAVPLTIVLPVELMLCAADQTAGTSTPTRVASRTIDMSPFPSTMIDGRTRSIKFFATIESSNSAATATVQLKNVTDNAVVAGTVLTTTSLAPVELSSIPTVGTTSGSLRTDAIDLYDVQLFLTGGGGTDFATCSNCRVVVMYSPPALISNSLPPALPVEVNFVSGSILSNSTTLTAVASRKIDMSQYPATLPDGRSRTVTYYIDFEPTTTGNTANSVLFDVTDGVAISGTNFSATSTVAVEFSASLTVGSAAGNLRNDAIKQYEVRTSITGGPSDRVICNNARIVIKYS